MSGPGVRLSLPKQKTRSNPLSRRVKRKAARSSSTAGAHPSKGTRTGTGSDRRCSRQRKACRVIRESGLCPLGTTLNVFCRIEIFGPVLTWIQVDTLQEAIDLINRNKCTSLTPTS